MHAYEHATKVYILLICLLFVVNVTSHAKETDVHKRSTVCLCVYLFVCDQPNYLACTVVLGSVCVGALCG